MSTKEISVNSIRNNLYRRRPRKPLVHILIIDEHDGILSAAFHPRYARKIAAEINKAAKRALANQPNRMVDIKVKED